MSEPEHYKTYKANGSVHNPQHRFDCDNCKFGWCCGPCCPCWYKEPPPEERLIEVATLMSKWWKKKGVEHTFEDAKAYARER